MNRIVTGYQVGTRSVIRQNTFTKLDFLKAKVVMKLLILGVFVVTLSIFYIWSRVQIVQMGYEINEYKKEQVQLEDENKKLSMEYTLMKSPKRITEYAQKKLNMKSPDIQGIIEIE